MTPARTKGYDLEILASLSLFLPLAGEPLPIISKKDLPGSYRSRQPVLPRMQTYRSCSCPRWAPKTFGSVSTLPFSPSTNQLVF